MWMLSPAGNAATTGSLAPLMAACYITGGRVLRYVLAGGDRMNVHQIRRLCCWKIAGWLVRPEALVVIGVSERIDCGPGLSPSIDVQEAWLVVEQFCQGCEFLDIIMNAHPRTPGLTPAQYACLLFDTGTHAPYLYFVLNVPPCTYTAEPDTAPCVSPCRAI